MRKVITLCLGAAGVVAVVTGAAMAAPATPSRPPAAVQAYRMAIRQDCQSGVWAQSELEGLYRAARATGYRGYLPTPEFAQEECVQAP
jgi:hypothetical protein